MVVSDKVLPGMEYVDGVIKIGEAIILIHDLDKFLYLDEEKALDEAIV